MAPLLAELGTPSSVFLQEQNWIDSVIYLAGTTGINSLNTTLAPDTHDTFFATSTFVPSQEMMVPAAADALMNYFYGPGATSKVEWFVILCVFALLLCCAGVMCLVGGANADVTLQRSVWWRQVGRDELACGLQCIQRARRTLLHPVSLGSLLSGV